MRRYEREIHDPDILAAMLDTFDTAYLGLHDEPFPYIVPLSFGYRIADGKLYVYVHSALEGHKLDLMRKNPNVSLAFSTFNYYEARIYRGNRYDYRSVLAYGTIREIDPKKEPKNHARAINTLVKHMRPNDLKFNGKRVKFIRVLEICCDLELVYGKSQVPIRTIEDVPNLDVPNLEPDTTPYDITDLLAKRYHTVWPLTNRKELSQTEKNAFRVSVKEFTNKDVFHCESLLIRLSKNLLITDGDPKLDLFVFLADESSHIKDRWSVVFYNNHIDESGNVRYDPDTENVLVALNKLPDYASKIIFVASVYEAKERHHDLSMFESISIELIDSERSKGLLQYSVKGMDDQAMAVTIGELIKTDEEWRFHPINQMEYESRPSILTEAYGLNRGWGR